MSSVNIVTSIILIILSAFVYVKYLELQELKQQNEKLASDLKSTNQQLSNKSRELTDLQKTPPTTKSETTTTTTTATPIATKQVDHDEVSSLKSKISKLDSKLKSLTDSEHSLKSLVQEKESQLDKNLQQIESIKSEQESQISNLKTKLEKEYRFKLNTEIERLIVDKDLKINDLNYQVESLSSKLKTVQVDFENKQAEDEKLIKELQQKNDSAQQKVNAKIILVNKLEYENNLQVERNKKNEKEAVLKDEELRSLEEKYKSMTSDFITVSKDLKDSNQIIIDVEALTERLQVSQELLHKELSSEKKLKSSLLEKVTGLHDTIVSQDEIINCNNQQISFYKANLNKFIVYLESLATKDPNFPQFVLDRLKHNDELPVDLSSFSSSEDESEDEHDGEVSPGDTSVPNESTDNFESKVIDTFFAAHEYIDLLVKRNLKKRELLDDKAKELETLQQSQTQFHVNNVILQSQIYSTLQGISDTLKDNLSSEVLTSIDEKINELNNLAGGINGDTSEKEDVDLTNKKNDSDETLSDKSNQVSVVDKKSDDDEINKQAKESIAQINGIADKVEKNLVSDHALKVEDLATEEDKPVNLLSEKSGNDESEAKSNNLNVLDPLGDTESKTKPVLEESKQSENAESDVKEDSLNVLDPLGDTESNTKPVIEESAKSETKDLETKGSEVKEAEDKQGEVKQAEDEQVEDKSEKDNQEEIKDPEDKQEEDKQDDVKQDDVKQEDVKQEDVKQEDVKQEDVRQEDVKQEDVKQEEVKDLTGLEASENSADGSKTDNMTTSTDKPDEKDDSTTKLPSDEEEEEDDDDEEEGSSNLDSDDNSIQSRSSTPQTKKSASSSPKKKNKKKGKKNKTTF
ncbi:Vesicular transport protein, putative [Candida maltosa Xu316]|uniref:Vesicular transport protein, putative n=1 Tax=Candida maltosa (strain Xu316) TaxID=1245528 RepID=M3HIR1_CANMX|nr:Vesicular transport protein, putative [Candida maltosa Xu316]